MPTLEHHGLVDMFRDKPPLAPHLMEMLFRLQVPKHSQVGVGDANLDHLAPVELQADLVLELRDANGVVVLSIIVEAQRGEEPIKKYAWVSYLAGERSRKKCPVVLLVIAPNAKVGAWAAEKIDLGLGLSYVQPLVLGPDVVPEVLDAEVASREPELAVLSAMVHRDGPNGLAVAEMALRAVLALDPGRATMYFRMVFDGLEEPLQWAVRRMWMEPQMGDRAKVTFPPFLQELLDRSVREGELRGEARGEARGRRDALFQVLRRAGISLTDEEKGRIAACEDAAMLDRWIGNVLGAKTSADVFAEEAR
jgi:hypothetical protein